MLARYAAVAAVALAALAVLGADAQGTGDAAYQKCFNQFCVGTSNSGKRCCKAGSCPATGPQEWDSTCHAFCRGVYNTVPCTTTTITSTTTTKSTTTITTAKPTTLPASPGGDGPTDAPAPIARDYVDLVDPATHLVFDGRPDNTRVSGVPALGADFSIALIVAQRAKNTGYLVAKSQGATHERVFTLLSSSKGVLVLNYRSASAKELKSMRFTPPQGANLADGAPHRLLVSIQGTRARIYIDDLAPIEQVQEELAQGIQDCGPSKGLGAAAAPAEECAFALGKNLGDTTRYAFKGSMLGGRFYAGQSLESFPADLVIQVITTLGPDRITSTVGPAATTAPDCPRGSFRQAAEARCQQHRACRSPSSSCSDGCATCLVDDTSSYCTVCMHGQYLYRGQCHADCNAFAGTTHVGDSLVGRMCAGAAAADPSRPLVEYQVRDGTPSSDRMCEEVTDCNPGNWLRRAATATSNAECVMCPTGYTDHDADTSSPCQRCRAGEFSPAASTGFCADKECPAGTTDHDESATTACAACSPGSFTEAGSTGQCGACPAGYTDDDADAGTACVQCAEAGTHTPAGSHGSCTSPEFQCQPGTVDGDGLAWTPCDVCNGLTEYQDAPSQRQCLPVTACDAGSGETTAPTASTNRECAPCTRGVTFSGSAGQQVCQPVSVCGDGLVEAQPPTLTSDRVCTAATTVVATTVDPCDGVDCSGDGCHEDGTCVAGQCVAGSPFADGSTCRQAGVCTIPGLCVSGVCAGTKNVDDLTICADPGCPNSRGACRTGECGTFASDDSWSKCVVTTTGAPAVDSPCADANTFQVYDCSYHRDEAACSSSDPAFHCTFNATSAVCELRGPRHAGPARKRRAEPSCWRIDDADACGSLGDCHWKTFFGVGYCQQAKDDESHPASLVRQRRQASGCQEGFSESTDPDKPDFKCPDGDCIIFTWKCDGQTDCAGGEDEDEESCPGNALQNGMGMEQGYGGYTGQGYGGGYGGYPGQGMGQGSLQQGQLQNGMGQGGGSNQGSFQGSFQGGEGAGNQGGVQGYGYGQGTVGGSGQQGQLQSPSTTTTTTTTARVTTTTTITETTRTKTTTTTVTTEGPWTGVPTPTTTPTITVATTTPTTTTPTSSATTTETSTSPTTSPTSTTPTTTQTFTPVYTCIAYMQCASDEFEAQAPTVFSDRVCQRYSYCRHKLSPETGAAERFAVGTFEATKPTSTSDRLCEEITPCVDGAEFIATDVVVETSSYPESAGSPDHAVTNRQCHALTECVSGEYESRAPTMFTDRACSSIRPECNVDFQYESAAPSASSDRVCSRLSPPCHRGQYTAIEAGYANNRVCEDCVVGTMDHDADPATPCAQCPDEFYQDLAGQTHCRSSALRCAAGMYEASSADPTSPRVCVPCEPGKTYQNAADQRECKPVSVCQAGTRVAGLPNATNDRHCEPCDGTTQYQDKAMETYCLNTQPECKYGFFEQSPPSSSADRVCTPCTQGTTFQDELGQDTCKAVSTCLKGSRESKAPTRASDRQCQACDGVSEYQDADLALSCKSVTKCSGNEFVQVEATPTSDAQCHEMQVCGAGHHDTGERSKDGDRVCAPNGECAADEYQVLSATSTSDSLCVKLRECQDGKFESVAPTTTSDRHCAPCQTCSSGEYEAEVCTPAQDTLCLPCTQCEEGVSFTANKCAASTDSTCAACTRCEVGEHVLQGKLFYIGSFYQQPCTVEADGVCATCSQCDTRFQTQKSACSADADTTCEVSCGFVPVGRTDTDVVGFGPSDASETGHVWNGLSFTDPQTGVCADVTPECRTDATEEVKNQVKLAPATPTSDTVCEFIRVCTEEEYQAEGPTATSNRVCQPATKCISNMQYQTAALEPFKDRECTDLTPVGGDEYIFVNHTATTDRQVRRKTRCDENQYVVHNGTEYFDQRCGGRPACVPAHHGSYLSTNYTIEWAQPATSDVPCYVPEAETFGPRREKTEKKDFAATADGQMLVAIFIAAVLIILVVLYLKYRHVPEEPEDPNLTTTKAEENEKRMCAGIVDSAEDSPFANGDFWLLEEWDSERIPLQRTYARKHLHPIGPTTPQPEPQKNHLHVDLGVDTDDEEVTTGEYLIMGGADDEVNAGMRTPPNTGGIQLLSQRELLSPPPKIQFTDVPDMSAMMDAMQKLEAMQRMVASPAHGVLQNPQYAGLSPVGQGMPMPGLVPGMPGMSPMPQMQQMQQMQPPHMQQYSMPPTVNLGAAGLEEDTKL